LPTFALWQAVATGKRVTDDQLCVPLGLGEFYRAAASRPLRAALPKPERRCRSLPQRWSLNGRRESCRATNHGVRKPDNENPMKRVWTIIGVRDVPGSFKWYQTLLGEPARPLEHDYFGQILDTDGTVLLCLHQWGAHDHPSLMSPDHALPGNGLLLFFRVDDFDEALVRARTLVPRFEEEPHVNPNTHTEEFSLRDPDGYYVTLSALSAP
jgi:catechol 2,3-dioxygenase-like lactoylglutathione lyase family enzyme